MPRDRRVWVLLVVVLAAAFGPAIASGALLAPGEAIALYFKARVLAAESLRQGAWPFWNPFDFGGSPLLAALQGGLFFPCNWFFGFLPPVAAMNAAVVSTYALAAAGMLAFGRAVGLGLLGAGVAAIAFALGGFMLAHMEHVAMVQAAAMLPVILWAIERLRATGEARWVGAFALALAFQILAGHPQMVVFGLGVAVPYALWRAPSGRFLGALAVAGVLAVGLAGLQLAPALDLIAESQRQAFPYDMLVAESLPPRQVLSLFFPFLFGAPPSAAFPTPYWGAGPWFDEVVGYVGLSTLVLAALAATRWRAEPRVRFWVVVALVAGVLALGGATPLYKLWAQLPLLKALRAPARHLMEVDLALAMLAGFGAQALVAGEVSRRRALAVWGAVGLPVLGVLGAVAVAGAAIAAKLQPFMPPNVDMGAALSVRQPAIWLPLVLWGLSGAVLGAWGPRRRWPAAALAVLVVADMWIFGQAQGWKQLSPVVPAGFPPAAAASAGRTLSIGAEPFPYYDFPAVRRTHAAGYASLLHERTVNGYDAFIKARYAALLGGMTHGGQIPEAEVWRDGHHAFDLLNMSLLRVEPSMLDEPAWRSRLTAPRWRRLPDEAGMARFENTRALPRAWRVTAVTALPSAEVDRRVTSDAGFAPRREALVEAPVGPGPWTDGTAAIESPTHDRLRLTTSGAGAGFVVVSEAYDAGWRAFEGDRALAVHRADGLLLGVEVPAGAHTVEMVYEPVRWRAGLAVSLLSGLVLAGWLWVRRRRERGS